MAWIARGDAAWERLRGTRWSPPPAAAASPERRKTYVFALEQAEQMFRAASTVGVATRPLLAFYGLSQAGRAVAAVATSATGDDWVLEGHGISCAGGTLRGPLPFIGLHVGAAGEKRAFAEYIDIDSSHHAAAIEKLLKEALDIVPKLIAEAIDQAAVGATR